MIITPLGHRIIVRYARKPFWSPTAPSKLFRIPQHTFYSPEEVTKIKELTTDYCKQEKVIMDYMKDEFFIPKSKAGGLPQEFIEKEQDIDAKLRREHDAENARIAKLREEFFNQEKKHLQERLMEEKMKREEELLHIAQEVDDFISENTSDPAKQFITIDNIDSAIEHALDNPISFEFFIDRSGRKNGSRQIRK